jgi:hypothetical protein
VQRRQQGVGFRQAADAVEGEGVADLGLAEEAPRVAGDQSDQHQLGRPLRRVLETNVATLRRIRQHAVGDGQRQGTRDRQTQGEAEAAREAGGHDRADDGEDERRVPVAGRRHGDDGESQLSEELEQAPGVVLVVAEREESASGRVDDERRAPRPDGSVDRPAQGGDDEADDDRSPADAGDERRERRKSVGGI